MNTENIERLLASEYGDSEPIAVVSAACRLPKSPDPILFWRNLFDGIDLLTDVAEGRAQRTNDGWVSRVGALEGAELFDAEFFGVSPQEARIMDPQHRVLLTCCWEALDSAGYQSSSNLGAVAVVASAKTSTYVFPTRTDVANVGSPRLFQALLANDKDYLATRVAYKLGLSGPAYTVQTACSSSLVAVHLACQHLARQECDLALAGGVGIAFPQDAGYHYREGMIFSRSGRCRAYDADADGTTIGNGAGVVLLKRLRDALRDEDDILAVIRGSAVNNDGNAKAGYTAPSVEGQHAVVREAIDMAEVSAQTITLVEGHGTATPLGDPIEVQALTRAFRVDTAANGYCALGSVKASIGHLDTAAGIASLLKAVLAVRHAAIPAALHFERPNPAIDLPTTPFFVPRHTRPWAPTTTDGAMLPRRAGVSSFGIGGTNCHVVVEEAPRRDVAEAAASEEGACCLYWSAATTAGLDDFAASLSIWLEERSELRVGEVASVLALRERRAQARILWSDSPASLRDTLASAVGASRGAHALNVTKGAELWLTLDGGLLEPGTIAALCRADELLNQTYQRLLPAAAGPQLLQSWYLQAALAARVGEGASARGIVVGTSGIWAALLAAGAVDHEQLLKAAESSTVRREASLRVGALRCPVLVLGSSGLTRLEAGSTLDCAQLRELRSDCDLALPSPAAVLDLASARWSSAPEAALVALRGALWYLGFGESPFPMPSRKLFLPPTPLAPRVHFSLDPLEREASSVQALTLDAPWVSLCSELSDWADVTQTKLDLSRLDDEQRAVDAVHGAYVGKALKDLNVFRDVNERLNLEQILDRGGILPKHRQLLQRWLRDLSESGRLAEADGHFGALREASEEEATLVLDRFATQSELVRLVGRAGPKLGAMVSGEADPVSVVFAEASTDEVEHMYERDPYSAYFNDLVAKAVVAAARRHRTASRFRVLEIGAGTGATTAAVVRELERAGIADFDYVFTDLGPLFLERAQRKFSAVSGMRFATLDMERAFDAQHFEPKSVDVVVAANVLHNARSLEAVLRRIRSGLLREDGCLVLRELTSRKKLFDCVFGPLVPEIQDLDFRRGELFADAQVWQRACRAAGYAQALALPSADSAAARLGESVIVASCASLRAAAPDMTPGISLGLFEPVANGASCAAALLGRWVDGMLELGLLPGRLERVRLTAPTTTVELGLVTRPRVRGQIDVELIALGDQASQTLGFATVSLARAPQPLLVAEPAACTRAESWGQVFAALAHKLSPGESVAFIRDLRLGTAALDPDLSLRLSPMAGSVVDRAGRTVASVAGILSGATPADLGVALKPREGARPTLYQEVWRPLDVKGVAGAASREVWVSGTDDAFTAALVRSLEATGAIVMRVEPTPEILEQASSKGACWLYVPRVAQEHATAQSLLAQQRACLEPLWKGLEGGAGLAARLCVVTRGAAALDDSESLAHPELGGVRGLLAVARHELSQLSVLEVDADESDASARVVAHMLTNWPNAQRLLVRSGLTYGCSLAPASAALSPSTQLAFDGLGDGTVVVTGGLSKLGRVVLHWLVAQGCRRLALLNRRAPAAEEQRDLHRLMQMGAVVSTYDEVDCENPHAVAAAVARLRAEAGTCVGVLHLAGQVRDARLGQLAWDEVSRALSVKCVCALALAEALRTEPLQFWVSFSSVATLFGPPGQAVHAAANSLLEAFGRSQHLGMQPLTVAWSAWRGAVRAEHEGLLTRFEQGGVAVLEVEEGLALLGTAWCSPNRVVYALASEPPREQLSGMAREQARPALLGGALEAGLALSDWLQQSVAALLRVDAKLIAPERELIELGLDSLMTLELGQRIKAQYGIAPSARALMQSTLAALTAAVSAELRQEGEPEGANELAILKRLDARRWIAANGDVRGQRETATFPLRGAQRCWLAARRNGMQRARRLYAEWDKPLVGSAAFSSERFERAWNELVRRHPALRSLLKGDEWHVLEQPPTYVIVSEDLSPDEPTLRARRLAERRQLMLNRVADPTTFPLFELRLSKLSADHVRLHLDIDQLLVDTESYRVILTELEALLEGRRLPPLDLRYSDYCFAERALASSPEAAADRQFWRERLNASAGRGRIGPEHLAEGAEKLPAERLAATARVELATWLPLKRRLVEQGAGPTAVVATLFARVLAETLGQCELTLDLWYYRRRPLHAQVHNLIGDFSERLPLGFQAPDARPLTEAARSAAAQIRDGLARGLAPCLEADGGGLDSFSEVCFLSLLGLGDGYALSEAEDPVLGFPDFETFDVPGYRLALEALEDESGLRLVVRNLDQELRAELPVALAERLRAAIVLFGELS